MQLSVATITPLAFLFVSCLTLAGQERTSLKASPSCSDLTKVEGAVIEFGEVNLNGNVFSRYSTTIDANGKLVTGQVQRNGVGIDTKGIEHLSPPIINDIQLRTAQISPLTLKAIVDLASSKDFWTVKSNSHLSRASGSTEYISINLPCANHQISITRNDKSNPLREVYTLLKDIERVQPQKNIH